MKQKRQTCCCKKNLNIKDQQIVPVQYFSHQMPTSNAAI